MKEKREDEGKIHIHTHTHTQIYKYSHINTHKHTQSPLTHKHTHTHTTPPSPNTHTYKYLHGKLRCLSDNNPFYYIIIRFNISASEPLDSRVLRVYDDGSPHDTVRTSCEGKMRENED